ncbi:MAG: homoserine O-acetyltransferase [Desulfovibrio sp.]|jgi:homoserine O-acetyltransferase|nr:homoserine O-acetyltransferase [Desulfovibrio sp.]
MSDPAFASSDAARGAGELPFARVLTLPGPLPLRLGGELPEVRVCYETFGQLNAARDNAVYVCHALSGDSHVARHGEDDTPGWWDIAVGPGKAVDTDRYFVICANVLGGCRGTTGPSSIDPRTGRPYGGDFPRITIADMVEVQKRLLDELGIGRLRAVIGGSMGGMMALTWAIEHPERVGSAILLATTHCLSSQALSFDIVGRNAIFKDPHYNGGQYYDQELRPDDGLAIARMIGHVTYLSDRTMSRKFDPDREHPREVAYAYEKEFSVGSYLAYQGGRFVERFDANSYVTLSLAMDHFNLGRDHGSLEAAMERIASPVLIASFRTDWLFPPAHSRRMVDALMAQGKSVSAIEVDSDCGHDAFLLENDLHVYGPLMAGFLDQGCGCVAAGLPEGAEAARNGQAAETNVRSIFYQNRLDLDRIGGLIPAGASVLDLGCGAGQLLSRLRARGCATLLGLELNPQSIVDCVGQGLCVVQRDLDHGLRAFADGQFDVVVLSQTLQAMRRPDTVLMEMLRVGKTGIVSFPNFAHAEAVRQLMQNGTSPVTEGLPFPWWSSPSIRFFSIKDFEALCAQLGIRVLARIAIDSATGEQMDEDYNTKADMAICVLSGPRRRPGA